MVHIYVYIYIYIYLYTAVLWDTIAYIMDVGMDIGMQGDIMAYKLDIEI